MEEKLLMLLQGNRQKEELALLTAVNEDTAQFGLLLTEEDAKELVLRRNESLAKYHRVEFGRGILDKLIYLFCDSQYINQENYLETLEALQDIFYAFKHESGEKLSDDELLAFMKEQFESVCYGSTEYLRDTCLQLELDETDYRMLEEQFRGKDREEIETQLRRMIVMLATALPETEFYGAETYFTRIAKDYAVRVESLLSASCEASLASII